LTRKIICTVIILVLVSSIGVLASETSARQLVDHLFVTSNQLPIQDIMIELDVSRTTLTNSGSSGVLQPASRDKIFFKKPNKLRVDSVTIAPGDPTDGKQAIIIRDGINRWMYVSAGQYPVKKGPDEPSASLMLPFNLQIYQQDLNREYVILGKESVGGIPTDVVGIVNPSSPEQMVKVWIDRSRWVPLKLEMRRVSRSSSEKDKPSFQRILYKEIIQLKDGRWIPFVIEYYENEVLEKVVVYRAVAVNVGLQDNLFKPMDIFIK